MTTATQPRPIRYRRPPLYAKQLQAIFHDRRYGLIEASTKSGKTYGALAWLTEQALIQGREGRNYWWAAPIFAQTKIAYRRLKRALPAGVFKSNDTELTVTLANGAILWFKSAEHSDSLYGEDVYAAVIDEASRVKEESWHAVRTTLTATRGPIRIIGNVKGRRNWFYRMARRAEEGDPNMEFHRITAYDAVQAGVLAEEEIDDAKTQLPDDVFRQLYLAEAGDDEGNPFGMAFIRACIGTLSNNQPAAWGWDLAKSVDWTVGIGLDAANAVAHLDRFQAPWRETLGRIVLATGKEPALVDSTGVGDPIVEALERDYNNFEGYKFTSPSKQRIMEGLAVAIQQGKVSFPDGPIVTELEAFEYVYTREGVKYSAPEGMHDDCVCALALAVEQATRPVWRWGPT